MIHFFSNKTDNEAQNSSGPVSPSSGPASAVSSSTAASEVPEGASSEEEPQAVTVSLEQAARPLAVEVSLSRQKVVVSDAENRMVKDFVCSTGEKGSETPTGSFTITDRGKSFYNQSVSEGAYYWTRFYKVFLFHSIPFDKDENLIPQEAEKLGNPASHGCVRLALEDAKWIYDNIPTGTKVTIE